MRKLLRLLALFATLLTVITCGTSTGDDDDEVTATAEGIVMSDSGSPMIGIAVSSTADNTTTDASGRFSVKLPRGDMAVVRFETMGYAPVVRRVETPANVDYVTVSAVMASPTMQSTVDVSIAPATVAFPGGSVGFPQGSIQLTDGSAPPGPVDVTITHLPPGVATLDPPVPLIGVDGSEQGTLVTFGMIDVTLSYLGQPANLAPGSLATVNLVAEPGDPETAGFWDADLEAGQWNRIGTAINAGGMWTADVSHFSWKNVDMFYKVPPEDWSCLIFRVLDPDGEPISGAEIQTLWGPNNRFTAAGTTDNRGELCHEQFPNGDIVTVIYRAFLQGDAPRWVEGTLTVTPYALGERCSSELCQVVPITIACASNDECSDDAVCDPSGVCITEGSTPPITNGWMGLWWLENLNGMNPTDLMIEQTVEFRATSATSVITSTTTFETCTTEMDVSVSGNTMFYEITSSTCPVETYTGTLNWSLDGTQNELTLTELADGDYSIYSRLE